MVISSRYGEWMAMELTAPGAADQWKPVAWYVVLQPTEHAWYPLALGYGGAYVIFEH
jgi:hypothetical protein